MGKVGQTKKVKSLDDLGILLPEVKGGFAPPFDKADRVTIIKVGNNYEVTGYIGFKRRDGDNAKSASK